MKVTAFFNDEFVNYGSYDNLRKIASYIDGFKNASRKVAYTVLDKNIKEQKKVSQLNSTVAEFSDYLHGDMSGVITNMAQEFAGTNNIPLLTREGNFGSRFTPVPSASRYIFTAGAKEFFNLFNKEDNAILVHQTFEGEKIEPRFYVPLLPMLLINGSEGVSTGFAQKVLNRNPQKIKQYILDCLSDSFKPSSKNSLEPYFCGFNGTIERGENDLQHIIKGTIVRDPKNNGKVTITEIPIGYDLKGYIDVLDVLEEKKIIQGYKDNSENDVFNFVVSFNSKVLQSMSDDEVLNKLKLQKKITENLTCLDENNKIRVFTSIKEICDEFIKIKLEYTDKRRLFIIEKMNSEIEVLISKYLFIKNVLENKIQVNNKSKQEIIISIEKIPEIKKYNDSWDFLLNLKIYDLTKEKFLELENDVKNKKAALEEYTKLSARDIYKFELTNFKL